MQRSLRRGVGCAVLLLLAVVDAAAGLGERPAERAATPGLPGETPTATYEVKHAAVVVPQGGAAVVQRITAVVIRVDMAASGPAEQRGAAGGWTPPTTGERRAFDRRRSAVLTRGLDRPPCPQS